MLSSIQGDGESSSKQQKSNGYRGPTPTQGYFFFQKVEEEGHPYRELCGDQGVGEQNIADIEPKWWRKGRTEGRCLHE